MRASEFYTIFRATKERVFNGNSLINKGFMRVKAHIPNVAIHRNIIEMISCLL